MRNIALSVRTELALILLVILAPLIALIAYEWYDRTRTEFRHAATAVDRLADVAATETEQFLRVVESTLRVLRERTRGVGKAGCDPAFADFRKANARFANIAAVDRAGQVLCAAQPPASAEAGFVGDREWFRATLAGAPFSIGKPIVGQITGRWIVTAAMPIRDERAGVIGAVTAGIDLLSWPPLAESSAYPADTLVTIIDAAGTVVARSAHASQWIGKNLRGFDVVDRALHGREGVMEAAGMDGIQRVWAFRPIAGTDWFVVAGIPSQTLFAGSRAYAWWSGIVALLGIGLAAMAAAHMTRRVSAMTGEIIERVRRAARGEPAGPGVVKGPREISQFAADLQHILEERAAAIRDRAMLHEQLDLTLQRMPAGCVLTDANFVITYFNPAAERMFGFTKAEIIGTPVNELVVPPQRRDFVAGIFERLGRGEPVSTVSENITKDGRKIQVEWTRTPLNRSDGTFIGVMSMAVDISERKRAEDALRASEERFRRLTELSSDWYWEQDENHRVTLMRGRYEGAVGREGEHILGKARWELSGIEPIGMTWAEHRAAFDARRPFRDFLLRWQRAGGSGYIRMTGEPMFDETGAFRGYRGVSHDVTNEHLAAEALRRSEQRLRQIIDLVPVKIFAKDINGRFILANRLTAEDFGRTIAEMEGKTFAEMGLNIPEAAKFLRDDAEVIRSGRPKVIPDETRVSRDGQNRIQHTIKVPFTFGADGETGCLGVALDITELKSAERRIDLLGRLYATLSEVNEVVARAREPAELYRDVCRVCCERMPFTLAYVALPDGGEARVATAHGATEFFDGIRIPIGEDAPVAGPIANALRERQPYISNDFLADPNTLPWREHGARIGTRATAAFPLLLGGQAVGALSLHSRQLGLFDHAIVELLVRMTANVSYALEKIEQDAVVARTQEELSRLNRELEARVRRRTEELESANRELESFSYSVSHDLRAPIRHIDGFVRLLTDELGAAASEKAKHYLARVSGAAGRMGMLIDDLLAFSRAARAVPVRRRVALDALVQEVMSELESDAAGRTIRWSIGPLPHVSADPTLLRLVIQNVVGNAVKYTRNRAEAEIEVGARAGANGQAVVYVRDNGVGFDMRYHDKLFGVFQRLHRDDEFEGTGIGLATAQRIVRRHGGEIWGEGELGKGATFSFTIGLAESLQ